MELTRTQCKQITNNGCDLRDFLESVNEQPDWLLAMGGIDDISEIQAILQGGCVSGAYMPAVTYYTALITMNEHSNEILQYCENHAGELGFPSGKSWSGLAVHFCSMAVELWCNQFAETLDNVNWD